jgi:hypothetical protein
LLALQPPNEQQLPFHETNIPTFNITEAIAEQQAAAKTGRYLYRLVGDPILRKIVDTLYNDEEYHYVRKYYHKILDNARDL